MTEYMPKIEMLIDKIILNLPSELFVLAPFLNALLADENGRYALIGLLLLLALIGTWLFFFVFQLLFFGNVTHRRYNQVPNIHEEGEEVKGSESEGFKFFKRRVEQESIDVRKAVLIDIEQEMIDIRRRYLSGSVLVDEYVAESQRLYHKARQSRGQKL